jgi:phosphate-selective porin OprO/OprP
LISLRQLLLLASCLVLAPAMAQTKEPDASEPLIFRDAVNTAPIPTPEQVQRQLVEKLRAQLKAIAAADISEDQRHAQAKQLMLEHPALFQELGPELKGSLALEQATRHLEKMFFEVAADDTNSAQGKQQILEKAPAELQLEAPAARLIAPEEKPGEIETAADAQAEATTKAATPEPVSQTAEAGAEVDVDAQKKNKLEVAVIADESVTTAMHDDSTVLRDVKDDKGGLVLFNALHIWVGGDMQFDSYHFNDIFNYSNGGDSETTSDTRRAEVVIRASLYDLGEIKAQYDVEGKFYRDLYWRWVSESTATSVTIGNQKEPMGVDFLVSSGFITAMERSAPSTAFKHTRSQGIRYNHWLETNGDDRILDIWQGKKTYITTSVGFFGEDIENTNNTDWAVTGRVTGGSGEVAGNHGMHFGLSASYRDGEFDSIAPRPEIQQADKPTLAQMDADKQVIVAAETLFTRGSLHAQGEFYYSDYRGGDIDAIGWGGYAQVGWLFDGHQRTYRPNLGLWAPYNPGEDHIFEVFARTSYTRGDDDQNSSNSLGLLTLGGNWYHGRYRASANLILADTERDVNGEDGGHAVSLRFQFIL